MLSKDEFDIIWLARGLLDDPGRCVFGAWACDNEGNKLKPTDPRATHWDMLGAIAKFSPAGLIPYSILRLIDKIFVEFDPIMARDFPFTRAYDLSFTHETALQFIDLMLTACQTPEPSSGLRFPDP